MDDPLDLDLGYKPRSSDRKGPGSPRAANSNNYVEISYNTDSEDTLSLVEIAAALPLTSIAPDKTEATMAAAIAYLTMIGMGVVGFIGFLLK